MNATRCTSIHPALTATGALLALACTLSFSASRGPDYAAETAVMAQTADTPQTTPRPARRIRASLSLPFFSFAQSLNPRT